MTCAYCNREAKMTAEHVWSSAILRLFEPDAPLTFDEEREKAHERDPVLRDLCGECNRGLSTADAEAARFASTYCMTELARGRRLAFDVGLVRLWAVKTAADMERFAGKKGNDWWKNHLAALRSRSRSPTLNRSARRTRRSRRRTAGRRRARRRPRSRD